MGTKSRESIYGASVRAAAEQAAEARKKADRLAVEAWNARMLGFQGPAQPSPTLGDALNAGYGYLEVRRLGCDTNQPVALDIVRRPECSLFMSWSDTCDARTARRCAAIRTSAANCCGRPRFRPAIRRRIGGRANDNGGQRSYSLDSGRVPVVVCVDRQNLWGWGSKDDFNDLRVGALRRN